MNYTHAKFPNMYLSLFSAFYSTVAKGYDVIVWLPIFEFSAHRSVVEHESHIWSPEKMLDQSMCFYAKISTWQFGPIWPKIDMPLPPPRRQKLGWTLLWGQINITIYIYAQNDTEKMCQTGYLWFWPCQLFVTRYWLWPVLLHLFDLGTNTVPLLDISQQFGWF